MTPTQPSPAKDTAATQPSAPHGVASARVSPDADPTAPTVLADSAYPPKSASASPPKGYRAFAYDPADAGETRRLKGAILLIAGACCLAGCAWTAMYLAVFGWGLTAALPLSFVVIVGSSLVVSHVTRRHMFAVYAQIICIMYITALIQWSIGGVFDSGFVLAWAFCGPISAPLFFPLRKSAFWFGLYVANLIVTVAFDETFRRHGLPVDDGTRRFFFLMNLTVSSLVVFLFTTYYVLSATTERERADALQVSLEHERAKVLGPYRLEEKLGAGGMGVVYRARHVLLRRSTAIKLLPAGERGAKQLERFEREVQLTSELNHPNIVAIYDYGHSPEGEFYYAMEHLPGADLESLVDEYGPMPAARVVPILRQIADALDTAHERGLIHRDIKPANVILSRFGKRTDVVKVLDFGLVKDVEKASTVTGENAIAGTPAYLAPEALTAPEEVGPSIDLYALGAVAFFLLSGRTVFPGRTMAEVFGHHIHTPPLAPSQVSGSAVPHELDVLVLRCLAKKPTDRYPSAAEMRDALDTLDLPEPWSAAEARAWWSTFEKDRASGVKTKTPEKSHRRTVTVELRDR